ncbi:hypothetical protein P153DRAFT_357770 [Dothidotthia symphoricarpi CBS 119687]|uniref:Uncharacterized protein n=1 Tax=Dothidotthia symphoricarpi CBS 119687 TaxID=1392245 RepID=A0A6A6AA33_9PLEO|nr:uncharacterized protein P153DRAFT_357770 [Dothidotthia symphoricarpi CBS 119687]KAF2128416.1 hypothetical protein P153DRAFT_357770 [Dothidotthia symphoricarpi CBS 119687]
MKEHISAHQLRLWRAFETPECRSFGMSCPIGLGSSRPGSNQHGRALSVSNYRSRMSVARLITTESEALMVIVSTRSQSVSRTTKLAMPLSLTWVLGRTGTSIRTPCCWLQANAHVLRVSNHVSVQTSGSTCRDSLDLVFSRYRFSAKPRSRIIFSTLQE